MAPVPDDTLRALIRSDPARGWQSFLDQYTPLILGLIRRAGVRDRDEMMEVYVLLCEQLSARGFAKVRNQDAARGSIGGWLAVVVRHTVVDWVRSQKGRRRIFQAVQALSAFDRRVFELYYWDERAIAEIAGILSTEAGTETALSDVLDALGRLHEALSDRHRADLLALAARARPPVPLDDTDAAERVAAPLGDPESMRRIAELNRGFERALAGLPAEDAAIVRLKFVEGLSNSDVERALGVVGLTVKRVQQILDALRTSLEAAGITSADAAFARHLSVDEREGS